MLVDLAGVIENIISGSGGGVGDPNAAYIVVSLTASLANERQLGVTPGFTLSDNGPGATIVLGFDNTILATTSGSTFAQLSGSLQRTATGLSYLVGVGGTTITTQSNGQIVISSSVGSGTGGGAPVDATYLTLTTNPTLTNERGFSPGPGLVGTDFGADSFYVLGIDNNVIATISGSTFAKLSGSLQRTAAGLPYLVGAGGTLISTAANGQVTVFTPPSADPAAAYLVLSNTSSLSGERVFGTGPGFKPVDTGPNANYVLNIDDNVIATVSGTTFQRLSGSLQRLADGTAYLVGIGGISITTQSNGSVLISGSIGGGGGGGGGGSGGGDPAASYVVLAATASLPNDRILTAGGGIAITDSGPGGPVTITSTAVPGFALANYAFVTSSNAWSIPFGTTFNAEPNLTASIVSSGNPVFIHVNANYTAFGSTSQGIFSITRDGLNLGHPQWGLQAIGPLLSTYNGNASVTYVDFPGTGSHSYSYVACNPTGSGILTAFGVGPASMTVFEMVGANVVTASIVTETTVAGVDIPGLSGSIFVGKGPVFAYVNVNYSGDSLGSWAWNTIKRNGTTLGNNSNPGGIGLTVASTANECINASVLTLDQSPTLGTTNTYTFAATVGAGSGKISKNGIKSTMILWEPSSTNFKYAQTPTNISLGSSYTDVVPTSPPLTVKASRPVLMGAAVHINTNSTTGRSAWSFLKNGNAVTTSSKGLQLLDGEGSTDWDRMATMFWLDTSTGGTANSYQIAGFNVSGSQFTAQSPTTTTFFLYELDAGTDQVAGPWIDGGKRTRTTASVSITGDNEQFYYANTKGQDIYFYVSGTINQATSSNPSNAKVALFGGDVKMSGSLSVGPDLVKLSGSSVQLQDQNVRIQRTGNDMIFFDGNNPQGKSLSQFGTGSLAKVKYHQMAPGVVGLWQLSGSMADTSGNNFHLSAQGTEKYSELWPGMLGYAFDGSSSGLVRPITDSLLLITSSMTVEAIVRIDSRPTSDAIMFGMDASGENLATNFLFGCYVSANSAAPQYFAEQNAGANIAFIAPFQMPIGEVFHFAMTRDVLGQARFYVNGEPAGSGSTGLALPNYSGPTQTFKIGTEAATPNRFVGSIASFKLTSGSVLSQGQIYQDFLDTIGPMYMLGVPTAVTGNLQDRGGKLYTTASVSFDSQSRTVDQIGSDVTFFVSGSTGISGSLPGRKVSVFGGDVIVSGSLYTTNNGWVTAMDQDFSLEPSQTFLTDTTYTIAGRTWTKRNSTNDNVAMAIVNGSGLVIQPKSAGSIDAATYTAPLLDIPLQSLDPLIALGCRLRITVYVSSENSAANFDASVFGVSSQSGVVLYTSKRGRNSGQIVDVHIVGASSNTELNRSVTLGAANNVTVLDIPILGFAQAQFLNGQYNAGFPAQNTLTMGRGLVELSKDMTGLTNSNMSLVLAAQRAGSATAYSVTIARVKVEYRL